MESSLKDLSQYRFSRAKEELETAKALLKDERYRAALNRSYYAIFHAMRSVNILGQFDSSKHSGVIAYFNQHYVKTGIFPKECSKIIRNASEIRERADYDDFFIASRKEAEEQVSMAQKFIALTEKILKDHTTI